MMKKIRCMNEIREMRGRDKKEGCGGHVGLD